MKHRENCHSFPIALFRVSTIASGSRTYAFARNTQHTCASSNHPWRNTLFLGGVKYFFGRGGGWLRAEATFCSAVLLSDLFWNLSDLRRLAHMEGVVLFGKRLWIFWQNCSQLQGQNTVCVSLRGCSSLVSWRFDRKGDNLKCHTYCWVISTHLFLFQGSRLWTLQEGEGTERGLLRGLYVMLVKA